MSPVRNSEGSSHTSSLRGKQRKISNGVNDPRLTYKDDIFGDEPHIDNPNDDLLEKVE